MHDTKKVFVFVLYWLSITIITSIPVLLGITGAWYQANMPKTEANLALVRKIFLEDAPPAFLAAVVMYIITREIDKVIDQDS